MLRKALLEWLYHWSMGLGCSLMAAGLIGLIVADSSSPVGIAFCLVAGVILQALSLVVDLIKAIPEESETC